MGLLKTKKLLNPKGSSYSKEKTNRRGKIIASYLSDKEFISRIYKEIKILNTKRTSTLKINEQMN
jgi:hypothetical protein